MVISRKREHLHSYNSQKCINDHQQKGGFGGNERSKTSQYDFVSHEAVLPVSLKLFKMPTNCQSRAKDKIKTRGKKNSSHSSCLTKPAVRIRVGGTKLVCSTKCSHPPFPGFQCLGKKKLSFHEYSTSK